MRRKARTKHVCFTMDVDGTQVTVLGDPNMDQKTRDALADLARAACKAFAKKAAETPSAFDLGPTFERHVRALRKIRRRRT